MNLKIQPEDVFVPGKYPINKNNAYAKRGNKEENFIKAAKSCSIPVIYGGYGVGKSSMALKLIKDHFPQNKVVYLESISGLKKDDLIKTILEEIQGSVIEEKSHQCHSSTILGVDAEIKAGANLFSVLKAVFRARANAKISKSEKELRKFITTGITDRKLVKLCEDSRVFLVLDELHKGEAQVLAWLPQLIKRFSNFQANNFKICLLGTSNNPTELVSRDPGIDRVISEIKLDSFSKEESKELIDDGLRKLGIAINTTLQDKLIRCCAGSPYILQFLLLDCAKDAITSGNESRLEIVEEFIDASLKNYADTKAQRMINQFRTSCETTGEIRYRKQILLAMASYDDEYITMDQIINKINIQISRTIKSTDISGSLRDLKSIKYGSILKDVEYPGGSRAYNLSTFTDPAMKFIIRWLMENKMVQ